MSVQINKSFERLEKPGDRKTQSRTTIVIFFRCGETEISAFNSRLMCAARLDLFFFHVLPLLTSGGIINPPPKTACRDQAHFRRDSVKISTRLHFSVRVHFFPLYFSCFLFFSSFYSPDECTRTDIKLSIREQLAAQTPLPLFAQNFFFHSVLSATIHRWSRYSKRASPKLLYIAVLWN